MLKEITSLHNPLIKKVLLLQEKPKYRREENVFIIDGLKEIKMAIDNNFDLTHIFFLSAYKNEVQALTTKAELIQLDTAVFEKIAYRGNTSKAIAIAQQKHQTLSEIKCDKQAFFVVLDGVEKPGNIGAMLRIADAANVTAVLISDAKTDFYNPNVVRSSVGCIFSKQIVVDTKENLLAYLKNNGVSIFTTSLKSSKDYLKVDYNLSCAIVVGTEAEGVNAFWEENSTQNIIIPMRGQNDSLNVSNSLAIVIFEALRQRALSQ